MQKLLEKAFVDVEGPEGGPGLLDGKAGRLFSYGRTGHPYSGAIKCKIPQCHNCTSMERHVALKMRKETE